MNNKNNIIASLLAILSATSSYAEDLQCPTVDNVRAASFLQSMEWGDEWLLFSNPVSGVDGSHWTVFASIKNKHATDPQSAIDFANNTIKTIDMIYPDPIERGEKHECWYVSNSLITVGAVDARFPPLKFAK